MDHSEFATVFGNRLYKKIICAVMRTQSELIRLFDLPTGGSHITFSNDTLIWSLTGENISKEEYKKTLGRKDLNMIKDFGIKIFKKNYFYGSADLKDFVIEQKDNDTIIIYHKNRPLALPERNINFFQKLFRKLFGRKYTR